MWMTHYSSATGICLARMAFLFACLRPGSLAWPQDTDPPTPAAEFRFIGDGRLITVPVTFVSDSYLFTVDSGSTCEVLCYATYCGSGGRTGCSLATSTIDAGGEFFYP